MVHGTWRWREALLVLSGVALGACRGADAVSVEDALGADGGASAATAGAGGGDAGGGPSSATAGSGGQRIGDPQRASLLTWNLENFPLTASAAAQATALLADLAPDLVAVQEIAEPSAFDALVASLDGYEGVLNDDPGAYTRVGLLWRSDRVTVSDVETLFSNDWYAFPRPPLKAHVTIAGAPAIDFVAVVLHLKAQLDNASADRRRAGCEALDAWVRDAQASDAEQDFVLLGDLNDKLTDAPEWNVFNVFLDRPDSYRFLTLANAEAGEHTYIPFESFIDHVLVTSDMLDEVGNGETEVLALENQVDDYVLLTDHRPVRTWLAWSEETR